MGICGTAMGSLAGILQSMGYHVTGSDRNVYPPMSTQLEKLGIRIMQDYKKENLEPRPDFVVVGNVISKHFEEAEALLASDIPYTSLPKAMGEFVIEDRNSIVVAGTHGKTTTTAMTAWVAEKVGLKPGFLIGGIPENFALSFRAPDANTFVIEGDEYDTAFFDKVPKFVHYRPKHVIFTSLEFDHADIYQNLDQIKVAFRSLMELIPKDGTLVYNADDPHVVELAQLARCERKVGYGIETGEYRAVEREVVVGRNQFAVAYQGQKIADLAIKFFGVHNTLNALACFALAHQLKWNKTSTMQALAEFKGVKRRQEELATPGGITVVEDFAHHPTAVRLTIQGIREKYQNARVFAVFEPRSATARRKVFQQGFMESLATADAVALPVPFDQSKIQESERFSSAEVIGDLGKRNLKAFLGQNVEEIVSWLKSETRKGDVILIMSNGGFDGIYQKLIKALS
jgi:UDP-N-acetylmuramate: L-alanyl-gamma-D-glutamyl-meso-diaminopimelate ligase